MHCRKINLVFKYVIVIKGLKSCSRHFSSVQGFIPALRKEKQIKRSVMRQDFKQTRAGTYARARVHVPARN